MMFAMLSGTLAHWVHDLDPFLIRFSDTFGIRYYGLAYVAGFLTAWALLYWYHRRGRSPMGMEALNNAFLWIFLGVFAGARLGYLILYDTARFAGDPLLFFRVWEGGMSSHGGFVGVILAVWWISHREKIPFLRLGDLFATVAPPGLFFGRIANFINGELWGRPTEVPWAVIFPQSPRDPFTGEAVPRHPSQLYEAGLEGLALFIYLQLRFWKSKAATRPGHLSGEFLIVYSGARIFCELFREPDAPLILGMSRGIFYSIFLALGGAGLVFYSRKSAK